MRELVKHLWKENKQEIISKSLKNCHCMGLDSIMLLEAQDKTIRLFSANSDHELYRNLSINKDIPLSVGFHPHHCNLTMLCIYGNVYNWIIEPGNSFALTEYIFKSKIKGGNGRFDFFENTRMQSVSQKWLRPGESIHMMADELHTVGVKKNEEAAWFILEGQEDFEYCPSTYSNHNPNEDMAEQMYQSLSESEIAGHLFKLNLI